MRVLLLILSTAGSFCMKTAHADAHNPFSYGFEISIERSALDGLSLGNDPSENRLVEEDLEFELALEYRVTNDFYLFITAALIDESETIDTAGIEDDVSGLERKAIGFGYFFGEELVSHLRVGRTEFVSASEWWLPWDEELDAIRLDSSYGDIEATLALAEEQARESTGVDFIDPEFDGVRRFLLEIAWEIADGQSLLIHYIDQTDNSSSFNVGEFEDDDRIDEEDADLEWIGIGYQGEFDLDSVGDLEVELHAAEVSGDETVYEFDDPLVGRAEVADKTQHRVSGDAYGMLLSWTPAISADWTLVLGRAVGSGDSNPDSGRVESFRQSGLQGESDTLGELYQPELSNLVVDVAGIRWAVAEGVQLALLRYDYEQGELAQEMRDVSIEADLTGTSRDLGQEIDLILTITARENLEIVITAAEFDPGNAYGASADETSNFINFELDYAF